MEEIKPVNFILDSLNKASSADKKVETSEVQNVFADLKNALDKNGDSIPVESFYSLFSQKYQFINTEFVKTSASMASMDKDNGNISYKDFGLFQASYEILQTLNSVDKDNISDTQVLSIANVLSTVGEDGKTLEELYQETVKALGLDKNTYHEDLGNALKALGQKFYTEEVTPDSKLYISGFSSIGQVVVQDFINSQTPLQATTQSQSSVFSEFESTAPTPAPAPIESSVALWSVNNTNRTVTTQYNEVLVPKEVNQNDIILSDLNENNYGFYYDKPNPYLPYRKGKPLGYYTIDSKGNTVFFEYSNGSNTRVPDGFIRMGNSVYDSQGNKMQEKSTYETTQEMSAKGYRLEQGNYDRANRYIFDKKGNVAGLIKESNDGLIQCFLYEKPVAKESLIPQTQPTVVETQPTTVEAPQTQPTTVEAQPTTVEAPQTQPTTVEAQPTAPEAQPGENGRESSPKTDGTPEPTIVQTQNTPKVQGWNIDSQTGKITTEFGETISVDKPDKNKVILGNLSSQGYGVYYAKPASYSDSKGKPLGYYTLNEAGEYQFYKIEDSSSRRLPEHFRNENGVIKDENGNTARETNIYEITSGNYKLEQGNYDKSSRKIYDKDGKVAGIISYFDDGYIACYMYNTALTPELEEFKDEVVTSDGTIDDKLTSDKLSEKIDSIISNDNLKPGEKLELLRNIKNQYGDALQGKLDYNSREFFYFIEEFMPSDSQSKNFSTSNLIEMIEIYKHFTGTDFSTLGEDLSSSGRLDKFLKGMVNAINLSDTQSIIKLNENFDFISMIHNNYNNTPSTERNILKALFAAIYNTHDEDQRYAERNDISYPWYVMNKPYDSIIQLDTDKYKNAREARAYIYKACNGDIGKLIERYKIAIGDDAIQEKQLKMLFKLFLGYSLDEIKEDD